jgi:hypothetical protein
LAFFQHIKSVLGLPSRINGERDFRRGGRSRIHDTQV